MGAIVRAGVAGWQARGAPDHPPDQRTPAGPSALGAQSALRRAGKQSRAARLSNTASGLSSWGRRRCIGRNWARRGRHLGLTVMVAILRARPLVRQLLISDPRDLSGTRPGRSGAPPPARRAQLHFSGNSAAQRQKEQAPLRSGEGRTDDHAFGLDGRQAKALIGSRGRRKPLKLVSNWLQLLPCAASVPSKPRPIWRPCWML